MNVYWNRFTQIIKQFIVRLNPFNYSFSFVRYITSFFLSKPKPLVKDATEEYIEKQMTRYIKNIIPSEKNSQNIDQIFYNRENLNKVMESPNNVIELDWKSRVLIESTPRGTIIMLYDAYKEGFAYYSDLTGIPYKLLNAVAAKYTIVYRCRDFFIDEVAIPNNPSPFLNIIHDENKNEKIKKRSTMVDTISEQSPFVKYRQSQSSKHNTSSTSLQDKVTNKFLYRGKIHNFNPIQPFKKHTAPIKQIKTQFDKYFESESEAQSNLMSRTNPSASGMLSYKTFKTKILS